MHFSSLIFIFLYLPITLGIYYIVPTRFRNLFLLAVNLVFYGWGEPVFVLIMLVSVVSNYIFAILIERNRENKRKAKGFVLASVIVSLGLLVFFKYTGFLTDILREIPVFAAMPKINIALPIGISFYTFQAMSYTIDVYRGETQAQKSLVNLGTYISFFPQLIAGPIVRYVDVKEQLVNRKENVTQFYEGIHLFVIGLCKKLLIANQMGLMWDTLRETAATNGILGAWVGILAYAFQIYFDFSGYSDMARGLGKMFGFEFMINFDYPYISKSITEFWRRWHISLSSWFRDYVYIPLGGNRCSRGRHIMNLFAVWFLTGLWHGASTNFILWGLYYFVLLLGEKFVYGKYLEKLPGAIRHIYSLIFILLGWVIFYFEDMGEMGAYFVSLFDVSAGIIDAHALSVALQYLPLMLVSAVASTSLAAGLYKKASEKGRVSVIAEALICMAALVLCTAAMVSQSYNPFLYFRF